MPTVQNIYLRDMEGNQHWLAIVLDEPNRTTANTAIDTWIGTEVGTPDIDEDVSSEPSCKSDALWLLWLIWKNSPQYVKDAAYIRHIFLGGAV